MKKKKVKLILLTMVFMLVCLLTGFSIYKYFSNVDDSKGIRIMEDGEEINLGVSVVDFDPDIPPVKPKKSSTATTTTSTSPKTSTSPTATTKTCTYSSKTACENANSGRECWKMSGCYVVKECSQYYVLNCPSYCTNTGTYCTTASTPTPTATGFQCHGLGAAECSSGEASSRCKWARGGCYTQSEYSDMLECKPGTYKDGTTCYGCSPQISVDSSMVPQYVSPSSGGNLNVSWNNNLRYRDTCGPINVTGGDPFYYFGGSRNISFSVTGKCGDTKEITLTHNGKTLFTKKVTIRNNWRTISKIVDPDTIPKTEDEANAQGSDYKNAQCTGTGGSKQCTVDYRGCGDSGPTEACYYSPSTYLYSWTAVSPGGDYVIDPNIKNSGQCDNVCYCKPDGTNCGIWAKKGWEGYEEIKDANGNNIRNMEQCNKPTACYCQTEGSSCSMRVKGTYDGYYELTKNGQTITNASECVKPKSCYYKGDPDWKYCWNTHAGACGTGYTLAPGVTKEQCVNVCYCNEDSSKCGVWARKGWTGYEEVKDKSGKNITEENMCKRYNYCCVSNGFLELSDDVKYLTKQLDKNGCPANYTLLEGVGKNQCKKYTEEKIGSCSKAPITSSDPDKSTNVCEGSVSSVLTNGQKCANTDSKEEKSFYKITCVKTNTSSFDYGNDNKENTKRELYNGEGFAYKVSIKEIYNCTYTFYDTVWNDTFNTVLARINRIDTTLAAYAKQDKYKEFKNYIDNVLSKKGVNNPERLYELYNMLNTDLAGVVNDYKTYKVDITYPNLDVEASIDTKESGTKVTTKYGFQRTLKSEGIDKKSSVVERTLSNGVKVQSYVIKNEANPRVEEFVPKRVCVNKFTGTTSYVGANGKCPTNTIDGGNKIYIGYNTDKTENNTYPITVTITGLGSEVTNIGCNLIVLKTTYTYRPIEVANPFINSDWKKGDNWVNSLYDFTNVIHSTTWSENLYKKIELPAEDIGAIQKSNSNYKSNSPYIGLCDRIPSSSQDAVTQKICRTIK